MIGFFRALRGRSEDVHARVMHEHAIQFGVALVTISLAATALAGVWHWRALSRLRKGEAPELTGFPLSLALCLFAVLLGAYGLWAVMANR